MTGWTNSLLALSTKEQVDHVLGERLSTSHYQVANYLSLSPSLFFFLFVLILQETL